MRAKFVNESKKYPMRKMDLDPEIQEEFGIPDWALWWNGVDIPEAAEYVDDRLVPGDVTANDRGEELVVIRKDDLGAIATKAFNLDKDRFNKTD